MAIKRALRNLKGTLDLKLTLRRSINPHLVVYADTDFAGEPEGDEFPMCLTSGVIGYMHGVGALFCTVHLERTLSLSTVEAEYKTFTITTKLVDIRQFPEDIGFPQTEPTIVYNENQAAIAIVLFAIVNRRID